MNLATYLSEQPRGTAAALAKALAVRPVMVSQWLSGAKSVPIERCVAIERATGGAVTRQDLRPNDWRDLWPELERRRALKPAEQQPAA